MRTQYAVTTYQEGRWVVRGFARMATARSFARREMQRLRMGLFVHRVNPDLTVDQLVDADRIEDIRWVSHAARRTF